MLRLLVILILLPFVGLSQIKTDAQLTNDLNNLVPNNTSQLIKPVHIRTVIQNGYDSRVSMYGETGILGKLTYASLFTFSDQKDIVTKKYVDDAIAGFSGGVPSFNGRTGAITPLSTDYSSYYYPATGNPSGFLTTAPVTSVFSRTGVITAQNNDYNTSQVTENTNLYYTDVRARAALSNTSPITYSGGVIGIQLANTSQNGYLSSTDWNTFNGKQNALGFTAANDALVMHLAGPETATGLKTFTGNIALDNNDFINGGSFPVLQIGGSSSLSNYLSLSTFASEVATSAKGSATNISYSLLAKGTGTIDFNSPTKFSSLVGTDVRVLESDAAGNVTATKRRNRTLAAFTGVSQTNTAGTFTAIYSYTVPANTLSKNGDKIIFEINGENGTVTGSSRFRFDFDGATSNIFANASAGSDDDTQYGMRCYIVRLSQTDLTMVVESPQYGFSRYNFLTYSGSTPVDFSTAQVFTFQGDADNATHNIRSGNITFEPAP